MLQIGSTAGITSSGATGNIQVTGTRTFNAGANYTYNGTAGQNTGNGLPTGLTGTLTINNPGNTVALNSALTVANGGTVNIVAGTFAAGTSLTLSSTSSITRSGGTMTGTPLGAGVYNVTYTGNSMTTSAELSGSGLNNVTMNLTAGQTLTLGATAAPNGNLSVSSGVFDIGSTYTINRSASGGTLTVAGTLRVGGANTIPANYSTHSLSSGTVEYSGTAQNVSAESYGSLTTSGSGTKTLQAGTTTVTRNLTIGAGTVFATGANNFGVAGNWVNNVGASGFTTSSGQTVTFSGTAAQTISGATTFYNLTVNNNANVTLSSVATISGTVALGSSGKLNISTPSQNSTANALTIGGVSLPAGRWGSTGSAATYKDNTRFNSAGSGILTVSTGLGGYRISATTSTPRTGANDQLTITLVDGGGDTITSFSGDKSLTFSGLANAPSGAVPTVNDKTGAAVNEGTATTITFASGVSSSASSAAILVAKKAESATLHVTDGTYTDASPGQSLGLTVSATTANKLVMKTEPSSSVAAGAAFSTQPAVYVQDTYGNVVTTDGSTVTATVQAGTGPLTGNLTAVASSGVATFSGLDAPTTAQTGLKLTFTDGSLASAVDTTGITVNPGAVSQLVMNPTTITSATAGTSVSGSFISITAKDANGNVCSSGPNDFNSTVTFGGTAGATGTSAAFTHGVLSTFPTLTPTAAGSGKTVTATPGSIVGTTTITTVNPGAVSQLVMNPTAISSATAGTPVSFTSITAEDANGNVCSGGPNDFNSTVTFGGTAGATGTSAAFTHGVLSTFPTLTPTVSGSGKTVTATSGSIVGTTTITTVNPGTASKLVITSLAVTVRVGVASSNITVQRQDQYGNAITTDASRTVTLSSTSSGTVTFTPASPLTIANGSSSASFTYTDTQAGTPTITAASTSPSTITPATQQETVVTYTIVATGVDGSRGSSIWINEKGTPVQTYFSGVIPITLTDTATGQQWNRDTLCVQLFADIYIGQTYGSTVWSPAQVSGMNLPRAAWLVDNALFPAENTNYSSLLPASDWVTNSAQGAGIQLAVWDIVEDGGDGFSSGSVQASSDVNHPTPSEVLYWANLYETLSLNQFSYSAYVYSNAVLSSGSPVQMLVGPEFFDNGPVPLRTFSLGNRVFADTVAGGGTANNGVQEGAEPGIAGVVMKLYAADGSGNPTGSLLATTATDGNGYYRFDGLPAGTYVPVVDVNGSGLALSGLISSPGASPDTTITGDVKDHGQDTPLGSSSVLSGGIAGAAITLGAGLEPAGEETGTGQGAHGPSGDAADNLTDDFGFCQPVTIGNLVWVDSNGNGVQDSGELGIAGVTVTLTGTTVAGVAVTDHATTGSDGSYLFTEPTGTYTVTVDASNSSGALAGYTATATGQGTAATDSNVNPSRTTPAGLTSGSSDLTVDFGFYQPVTIGNLVWNDANANGVQDAGEVGIAGVTLTLTGTDGAGQAVSATTTSDANGLYQFTEPPGSYTVTVSTPIGYTPTATGQGTVDTDSNPNGSSTTLAEGQSDQSIDFGFYQPVTIGDCVWKDANANGIQDADEVGIAGVTVTVTGTDGANHAVSASTTTDVNGHYQFSEPPGTYTVAVSAPSGYVASPMGQGMAATDSNPSPSGTTPATLASGGSDETVDFGFYTPSPTAATFAWLGAYVDQGQVLATWQTYSESGLLGFDVGRSTAGAEEQLVTLEPVLADGRSMGYRYTIADSSARLPGEYTYRLVGYRDDGSTEELARVKVSLAADASADVVRITGIETTGDGVRVRWVGGRPPYVLESSPSLGPDAAWSVVGPAEAGETEAVVPPDGQSGFFRVRLGEQ